MTRLKEEWILDIEDEILAYDRELTNKTGMSLIELSAKANGILPTDIERAAKSYKVASIPVATGQGIIGSFSQSVAAILCHMGFQVFITEATDVDGIYEAYQKQADCFFLADDKQFIGINRSKNIISDNNSATAKGYVAALEQIAGPLSGQKVLVLGYGIVGRFAAFFLKEKGAVPIVYDIDPAKTADLDPNMLITDIGTIKEYPLLFDATNKGDWIDEGMLHPKFIMTAPGIPLSLGEDLYEKYKSRIIHDWLQLGTAVMMGGLCK